MHEKSERHATNLASATLSYKTLNIIRKKMRIFKLSNIEFRRHSINLLIFSLGTLTSGFAFSTTMTVYPSTPKGKINKPIPIEMRFRGKVESITDWLPACSDRRYPQCTVVKPSIKIFDQNKVFLGYFNSKVTCTERSLITVRGVNYTSCRDPVVKFDLPAKSAAGTYTYTATRDVEMFAEDQSITFVVKVGPEDGIQAILPIILD